MSPARATDYRCRVFGLSLSEFVVVLLIAVVVIGPRQLPTMLRTAGRWVAKFRQLVIRMRTQSGLDELLRSEGLDTDLEQLRTLLRKGNLVDALTREDPPSNSDEQDAIYASPLPPLSSPPGENDRWETQPSSVEASFATAEALEREYPRIGVDAYGVEQEAFDPYVQASEAPPSASGQAQDSAAADASTRDDESPVRANTPETLKH